MNKKPIDKAFDNLISAIDQYIDKSKKDSINAIHSDDMDRAKELLSIIKQAIEYRSRIVDQRNEWQNYFGKPSLLDAQTDRFIELITSPKSSNMPLVKSKLHQGKHISSHNISINNNNIINLDPDNLESITYTTIVKGKIGDVIVEDVAWREFVNMGIQYALQKGLAYEVIGNVLALNIKRGEFHEHGFLPVANTDISLQNMAADRAAKSLIRLSRHLNCDLEILIEWSSNENAQYPGRQGRIECKAAAELLGL